jgi:acyl dehydratase
MAIIETRGRYYEELIVGDIYRHSVTRTVTEVDNLLFSALTYNTQPLHLDEEFGKASPYGTRIVNSVFTLGLLTGISVTDLTLGTTLGNLGFGDVAFVKPVRIGDTLRGETEVMSKRESGSRPSAGIVQFETRGFNQHGELVAKVPRTAFMMKKPQ